MAPRGRRPARRGSAGLRASGRRAARPHRADAAGLAVRRSASARRWLYRRGWRATHVCRCGSSSSATCSSAAPARRRRSSPWSRAAAGTAGRRASSRAATAATRTRDGRGRRAAPRRATGRRRAARAGPPHRRAGGRRRDRVAAGHALLQAHPEIDVIVCDDGLQHLALEPRHRDRRLRRARRRQRPVAAGRPAARSRARRAMPRSADAAHAHRPLQRRRGDHAAAGLHCRRASPASRRWTPGGVAWRRRRRRSCSLRGRAVVAAAGVARPGRFFAMLREPGSRSTSCRCPTTTTSPSCRGRAGTSDVVVTEKDAVKIAAGRRIGARIWVATLDFEPEPAFDRRALLALLSPPATPSRPHGNPTA